MILLCLAMMLYKEPEVYALEDLYAGAIIGAASFDDSVVFSAMTATPGEGFGFKLERYIFNFGTQSALLVEDKRIPDGASLCVAGKHHFFLIENKGDTVSVVSKDGRFVDHRTYDRFFKGEGDSNLDLIFAAPYSDGKSLLTMRRENTLFLLEAEMEEGNTRILHAVEVPGDMLRFYWISNGVDIFFVNGHSSQIERHDPATGWEARIIRKSVQPVLEEGIPAGVKGISRYKVTTLNPISLKGQIFLQYNQNRNYDGEVLKRIKKKHIRIVGSQAKEQSFKMFPIAGHGEKALMFDPIEGVFQLGILQ